MCMDNLVEVAEVAPEPTPEEDNTPSNVLTGADHCDQCGHRAYVDVLLKSGSSLLFCFHHWNANKERIKPLADVINDESYKLFEVAKLDVSA